MRLLIYLALVLASIFASTFLIIKFTGLLTLDDIKAALTFAANSDPVYVALLVVLLLFSDLFIAMPTLTICVLAGYFLGGWWGGASASLGMMLAGLTGYSLSYHLGPGLLLKICKKPRELASMQQLFNTNSGGVILLCRALPILPEVVSCLAGVNRMPLLHFLAFYSLATLPYGFIAAQAGSRSSLTNPMPAILTAICLSLFFWLSGWMFLRSRSRPTQPPTTH